MAPLGEEELRLHEELIAQQVVARLRVPAQYRDDALALAALAAVESQLTYDPARSSSPGAWANLYAKYRVRKWLWEERQRPKSVPIDPDWLPAPDPYLWVNELDHIQTTLSVREAAIVLAVGSGYRMADICRAYRTSSNEIAALRSKLKGQTKAR